MYTMHMTAYVALIRGIGPGDPKKSNESLRSVLESLGLKNVRSVISSGNVVFESDETDIAQLEHMIESAWPTQLGFKATTIVRSQEQLQSIIDSDPFDGTTHSSANYQLVTFFKQPTKPQFDLPYYPPGKPYKVVGYKDNVLYTVTDNSLIKTSNLMTWLEKQFGKEITSRTPLTVERILKKMI
jgi:uncharacterized protein (DUF1697 family)